jgi:DNA-binding NtrC family response regulator
VKTILAVDDEQELLRLFRELFADRYHVETASNGAAALAAVERVRPDVVFLDVNMPGMTGVDVLKLLRESAPSLPVIMVTANEEVDVAAECIKAGAFGYVPKPFNLKYMEHMAALATGRRDE